MNRNNWLVLFHPLPRDHFFLLSPFLCWYHQSGSKQKGVRNCRDFANKAWNGWTFKRFIIQVHKKLKSFEGNNEKGESDPSQQSTSKHNSMNRKTFDGKLIFVRNCNLIQAHIYTPTHNLCHLQTVNGLKDLNTFSLRSLRLDYRSLWMTMDHWEMKSDKSIKLYSQVCDFPFKINYSHVEIVCSSKSLLFNDASSSSCCGRNEKRKPFNGK